MTLILTANQAITSPIAGTPTLPDYSTGLSFDYNPELLRASIANGAIVPSLPSTGLESLTLNSTDQGTGTTFPTLTHAGPNGKAALTFAGNQMISVPANPGVLIETGDDITFALVYRATTYTDTQRILGVGNSDGFRYISPFSGGIRANGFDGVANVSSQITAAAVSNSWHVMIAATGGTGRSSVKVDGNAPVLGNVTRGRMRGLRLGYTGGGSVNAASAFTGDIARVLVFRRLLTESDINGLAYDLMTTYGIN